jgi:hypothetical protein
VARTGKQRGIAMLVLLVIIAMGTSWMVLTRLNAASAEFAIAKRDHNAKVLNRAKLALIGYVTAQANKAGENNPGSLPCPEDPGTFDSTTSQGTVGNNCGTTVKVGRFPWRTLGLDKLADADGEALWYVVSPNWGYNIGTNSVINSDSVGQLTVDGVANAAIALIIAPGAVLSVPASTGCVAWNQVRLTTGTPDWRNYLECDNASSPTDYSFVTTGPSGAFNDQVMVVTAAEMLAPLEGAIADRIQREIAPMLTTVYTGGSWGLTAGTQPVYPYPATFANPGTATYRGTTSSIISANAFGGLLPVNYVTCTEGTDTRCANSTFHAYSKASNDVQTAGGGYIYTQSTCAWQSDTYVCTGEYFNPTISVQVNVNVTNVAMGLRTIDTSTITCTAVDDAGGGIAQQNVLPCTPSISMQQNGSLNIAVAMGPLPDISTSGWGTYARYAVRIPRAIFGDHDLLRTTTNGDPDDTSWFMRNGWHKMTFYAVARGHTSNVLPSDRSCTTGSTCLTVTSTDGARPITPAGGQRVVLVFAGRSLSGASRPNATLTDYLEGTNAVGVLIRQVVTRRTFNDRIVVVTSN